MLAPPIKLLWEGLFKGPYRASWFCKFIRPRWPSSSLGLGAWAFFRKLKLTSLAATLGALAMMLNTQIFSGACWGVASDQIAYGFIFLALALVEANDDEPSRLIYWTRLALTGFCVGINVMEAADVGALSSMFVALYILFKSLVSDGAPATVKIGRGIARVAVVAVFAGFIAMQTVISLVGTQIQGVVGMSQSDKDTQEHWDYDTEWSLPKQETLGIFVPGLFGYRMDTPLDMTPWLQRLYSGGVYWGGMGRTPAIDRYFASGGKDNPPAGTMRFGYGGYYCGILVALAAFWAIAQSFRREKSPFNGVQKKFIWFWSVIMLVSLLIAWGRFAPVFYGLLYHYVPYFSDMRNPAKFVAFVEWAFAVLFAYGIHGISRQFLKYSPPPPLQPLPVKGKGKSPAFVPRKSEAAGAGASPALEGEAEETGPTWEAFDRIWLTVAAGVFAICVFGWLYYAASKTSLVHYVALRGFPDEQMAKAIASFSIAQAGWFLLFFAVALALLAIVLKGVFNGPRAKWGGLLLGTFLVIDLGRADLPFIIHWNYFQKYEVGMLNPIVDFLRQKPYEHRVAQWPFQGPPGYDNFAQLYYIEWAQHLFPYYNIQSLDKIQMPREPVDLAAYEQAFIPQSEADLFVYARNWQLTNTRYILGPYIPVEALNSGLDPVQRRFQIVRRFSISLKPGVQQYDGDSAELTVVADDNGPLALYDFTGALPRAKLYTDWQTNSAAELKNFTTNGFSADDLYLFGETGTNGFLTLKKLASPSFHPEQTVLLDAPLPEANPAPTNDDAGTVEFESYAPKRIVLNVHAVAPSVLLLNDKYDPNWRVTVDGKPAELFHANFIMQGVFVPAGQHTVAYRFSLPSKPFYVTLSAISVGIVLCGVLVFRRRR